MNRKTLLKLSVLAVCSALVFLFAPGNGGSIMVLAAMPFTLLGKGLRALSLSGSAGNIAAIVIYATVCILPLVLILRKKKEKEDWLLVLGSAMLFYVLYLMINPGLMPNGMSSNVGSVILCGTVVSVFVSWGILKLLRKGETMEIGSGYHALRVLLGACAALYIVAGFGIGTGELKAEIEAVRTGNTMPGQNLLDTYIFLFLIFAAFSTVVAVFENILSFEEQFKNCRVIRLEQNYRSTGHILNAANAVIRNNQGRKGKTLWTDRGEGEQVIIKTTFNEGDEANFVIGDIMMNYNRGANWRDHAILYRMNAQSNALEYAFRRNGMPYKVVGGTKFFDRAEVKDMLAYLCLINNPTDDLRLRRIVNTPSRKIGAATMDKAQHLAVENNIPLYEVLRNASMYPELKSTAVKLEGFIAMMEEMREKADQLELVEFYEYVCDRTGYVTMLTEKNDMESRGRLENVRELTSSINAFLDNGPDNPSLAGFLDEVALYTDLDSTEDGDNCVVMMTMHSAKGLEFPNVYVVGMEDGLFPGNRAMGEPEEMEEERRLCYVAMTRAMEKLTLTHARQRMLFGRTTPAMPSRFLEEVPEENSRWIGKPEPKPERHWSDDFNDEPMGFGGSFGGGSFGGGSYSSAPKISAKKPTFTESVKKAPTAPMLQLQPGESVRHSAFGVGLVVSVRPMGGDALIEVAFDTVGTKKLMLKAASAHLSKE